MGVTTREVLFEVLQMSSVISVIKVDLVREKKYWMTKNYQCLELYTPRVKEDRQGSKTMHRLFLIKQSLVIRT
jgi:hypothetical protein